jgi:hypothetical protein
MAVPTGEAVPRDQAIRSAKPSEKPYKLADSRGLTLFIKPNGSKLWRPISLRWIGKDSGARRLSGYLGETRATKTRCRSATAREGRRSQRTSTSREGRGRQYIRIGVAREWLTVQEKKLAATTYAKAVWTLETLIFPFIGNRPINEIKAADVLKVVRRIEDRGLHETAHRARQRCSQVFRFGIITERCEHDITADLRGALAPVTATHHASVTEPEKIGQLLRDIESYRGNRRVQTGT